MNSTPTFTAYAVKDRGKGKKPFWTRIGAAWPHKSGKGFTIELEAVPVDGKIVLMEPKVHEASSETFEAEIQGGAQ